MDCWTSLILITCFIIQGVDITWWDPETGWRAGRWDGLTELTEEGPGIHRKWTFLSQAPVSF